jgi:diguanylate cyclase (GGDEF)-like protein
MTKRRRDEHDPVPLIESPELQLAELETFEREYTIERFSQRELMLDLGAALWFLTVIAALLAGRFDEAPESSFQHSLQIGLVILCAALGVSLLTWVRKLDDRRTLQVIATMSVLALAINLVLSYYGPGALGGLQVAMLAITVYTAQFLKLRGVIGMMCLTTLTGAIAVKANYGADYAPHLLSQMTMYLSVLWIVAISVNAQKEDRVAALLEAENIAFSDTLTGLPNTRMLRRRAESLLSARNMRINKSTGLVLLDLDGFRSINTLAGHRAGDRILRAVAEGLRDAVPPEQLVARTGSDEFSVLVPDVTEQQLGELAELYRSVALAGLDRVSPLGAVLDVSVGTSLSGEEDETIESLLRAADHSMYLQKAAHERGGTSRRKPVVDPQNDPSDAHPSKQRTTDQGRWHKYRWSQRPQTSRYLSTAWALAGISLLVSMQMPDAVEHNETIVILLVVFTLIGAAVRYFYPLPETVPLQLMDIVFASSGLAVAIYFTGGNASPAVPVALLILIFLGWFGSLKRFIRFSVLSIAIVLVPIVTDQSTTMSLMDAVTVYGGLLISAVLLAVLYYNHLYLDRAQSLTSQLMWLDPRAGTRNRRAFEERLRDELERLNYGDREALAVVILDLGAFKSISADHGRLAGDRLLGLVAAALERASREQDLATRLGGDEFAVIAPGVDAESARALAQRLVATVGDALADSALPHTDQVRPSAGFALYGMHGRTADELLTAADVALTSAKTAGRDPNRVSSFVVAL